MVIDDFDFEAQIQSESTESSASSIEEFEELEEFEEIENIEELTEMEEPISYTLETMMATGGEHDLSKPQVTPPPLPDQIFKMKDDLHSEISSAISLLDAELSPEPNMGETVETAALETATSSQSEQLTGSEGDE